MRGYLMPLLLAVVAVASPCGATDVWEDLMPGVRHLHRTTSVPWDIHVVTVDLTNPRIDLRTVIKNDHSKPDGGEIVRSMCQRYNAVAGINCDFFAPYPDPNPSVGDHSHIPQGYCMTDGIMMLAPGHASPIVATRTTVAFPADNSYGYVMSPPNPGTYWWNVVAGGPRILRNGKVWGDSTYTWDTEGLGGLDGRQPRTGLAISADWRTLILATVDGRQASSAGMTCAELGALLKEFGGYNGLGFDSGGSTTMVINGVTVNNPSDGTDRRIADGLLILDKLRQGNNPMVHYETGFENLPYPTGPISGIDGWTGSADIVSGGHGGSQCVRVSGGSVHRNVAAASQTGVQWVECYAKVSSAASGACIYAGTQDDLYTAAAVRFGSTGQIEAYTTDENGAGYWTACGPYSTDTWYRVHVRLDYYVNTYQVFIDGVLRASGCAFMSSGANLGLRSVKFQETGGAGLFVDDLYAGSVDPDFLRVSPNTLTIVQGGKMRFQGVSAVPSVTWSVIEEKNASGASVSPGTIAQIDASGVLTANAAGSCKVQAQDGMGRVDRSESVQVISSQPITAAKAMADGVNAAMSGLIVTGCFSGYIYAEEPDRQSGIRIITAKRVPEGSTIYVTGPLTTTATGERAITATGLESY